MQDNQDQEAPIELVSSDALGAMERSQIDMQIATAKKYPRSIKQFMVEAESMISLNQEVAEGCNYKLKRKNPDGTLKIIEGPSIRLMEIAASAYTNIRFGSRIIGIDDEFVTAQGVAFDMQRNVAVTVETKRSIKTAKGYRYSTDMIMVTSNAAGSIARRNALLGGAIPRAYISQLADFAKRKALGEIKDLPIRLQSAFDYFRAIGVEPDRVLDYLEKPSMLDCTLEDLDILQGLKTALREGDTTLDTEFPKEKPVPEKPDLGQDKAAAAPATSTTVAASTPTTAAPQAAATTTKRPRKAEPPAQTTAAAAPAIAAAAAAPQPAQPAPAPAPTPEKNNMTLATELMEKLVAAGVTVDAFWDWLEASGRGQVYHFDPTEMEDATQLPKALLLALTQDGSKDLAALIRVHGNKK